MKTYLSSEQCSSQSVDVYRGFVYDLFRQIRNKCPAAIKRLNEFLRARSVAFSSLNPNNPESIQLKHVYEIIAFEHDFPSWRQHKKHVEKNIEIKPYYLHALNRYSSFADKLLKQIHNKYPTALKRMYTFLNARQLALPAKLEEKLAYEIIAFEYGFSSWNEHNNRLIKNLEYLHEQYYLWEKDAKKDHKEAYLGHTFTRKSNNLFLAGLDLSQIEFHEDSPLFGGPCWIRLDNANLNNTILKSVNFDRTQCFNSSFTKAVFDRSTSFWLGNFANSKFNKTSLISAYMRDAIMINVDFSYTNLKFIRAPGVDFSNANFRRANLQNAYFAYANLNGVDFRGANLYQAQYVEFCEGIKTDKTTILMDGSKGPYKFKKKFI